MGKIFAALTLTLGLMVSGCAASRGGQDVTCDDFDTYAQTPTPIGYVADIQKFVPSNGRGSSASVAAEGALTSPLDDIIVRDIYGLEPRALRRSQSGAVGAEDIVVSRLRPQTNILILSGGGQWGAFGAGLFLGMVCTEQAPANRNTIPCVEVTKGEDPDDFSQETRKIKEKFIDFKPLDKLEIGFITGVSTGGLQSLLLAVVLDAKQPRKTRIALLQRLLDSYAPASEDELVDRNGFFEAAFTGSVAGTDALREHVSEVLEKEYLFQTFNSRDEPNPPKMNSLVNHIGEMRITPLVGFVAGTDGEFRYVDMRRMVRSTRLDEAQREQAGLVDTSQRYGAPTRCVVATTLASAAMPVFHQQLRVMKRPGGGETEAETLFDGGVRRSVFIGDFTARLLSLYEAVEAADRKAGRSGRELPKMYVVRNGPTTSKPGEKIDEVAKADRLALRAYSLLVNELEVGSIASLRLYNPYGVIKVTTADGSEDYEASVPLGEDGKPSGKVDPFARAPCDKEGDVMFSPSFMRCLQNFGVRRGMGIEIGESKEPIPNFWPIRTIPKPGAADAAPEAEAANDNAGDDAAAAELAPA